MFFVAEKLAPEMNVDTFEPLSLESIPCRIFNALYTLPYSRLRGDYRAHTVRGRGLGAYARIGDREFG
jgi:hypothetical protein